MTRKTPSPMIESEIMIECDHMRMKKMSQEHLNEDLSINYSINGSTSSNNKYYQFNNIHNNNHNNSTTNNHNNSDSIVISPLKRLTSFEELAKKSESNSLLYIHEMDNNFSMTSSTSRSKPKSDYNICYNYKNLDENDDVDYPSIKHQMMIKKSTSHSYNIRRNDRKYSSSDNSPFDYDLLKEKRKDHRYMYDEDGRVIEADTSIKSYDRFFNSDDEIEEEYERRHNSRKKNSSNKYRSHVSGTEADDDENSSNSPPMNKSITPLNECIPLLSCDAEQTVLYHSPAPPAPIVPPNSSLRSKSKIPLRVGSNSMRKNSSISSPESDKSENGYQTSINRYDKAQQAYQSPSRRNHSNASKSSENKIRIKIKQNN